MSLKYARGTIHVFKNVLDHNFVNPKNRLVVLVRDCDETDESAFGVAITGTFNYPLPPTSISLKWHPDGRCKTKLRKECVADCTWIVMRGEGDFEPTGGHVPPIEFAQILEQVESYLQTLEQPDEYRQLMEDFFGPQS